MSLISVGGKLSNSATGIGIMGRPDASHPKIPQPPPRERPYRGKGKSNKPQGYVGDSILNSSCDVLMAALGFSLTARMKLRVTLAAILVLELGCLLWVRDNLTLNVLMLVYPSETIKAWQSAGQPPF